MSAKRRSLKAADGLRATFSSDMVIGMIGEEDRKRESKKNQREGELDAAKFPVPFSPRAGFPIRGPRQEPLGVATRTERAKR